MSAILKQVIENIGELSSDEKALVAHCLISSLEAKSEDGVAEAWTKLTEKRYSELKSGTVKGVSWKEIKTAVRG